MAGALQVLVLPLPSSTRKTTLVAPNGKTVPAGGSWSTFRVALQASVASSKPVRLGNVAEQPAPAARVWAGTHCVIAGGVVSRTYTSRLLVAVLLAASLATYSMV